MHWGLVPFLFGFVPGADLPVLAQNGPAHWSFQPARRSAVPSVLNGSWRETPIDAFILARLEKAGLRPNRPADRATLLRRVTFDLTGLPPNPDELEAFLNDTRPDAYVRVVERLLASPHFGERWAQHWLDVVRYAESNGYELDAERPNAWRYRDYLVRSFNQDKPFDRFVTEQVAGDLLAGALTKAGGAGLKSVAAELHIAAGFNRCGPVHQVSGNTDPDVNRQEVLTEMTTAVGSAFLGLTVGCARCHDHKFDPVSQLDYYRLQAFFGIAQPKEVDIAGSCDKAEHEKQMQEWNARMQPLQKQLEAIDGPYRKQVEARKTASLELPYRQALAIDAKKRTPEQTRLAEHAKILIKPSWDEIVAVLSATDRERRVALRGKMHQLEAQKPLPLAQAWTVAEDGAAPFTNLLKRGDPKQKLDKVLPAYPRALSFGGAVSPVRNRLDLARWLTHPDHPLTARVIVNRLWQYHFGRGLVATPNDFGLRAAVPGHAELLDWLATELVASGWSMKHMHRLMVLSAAYQQESRGGDPRAAQIDADNRFLWRMNRQRLSGEALRDSVLAVNGRLHRALGGPMIRIPIEQEVYDLIFTEGEPDGLWLVTPDVRQHTRRSLYLFNKRNVRLPLFEAFDQPDTLTPCPIRPTSTFAPQALILLNGPFMQAESRQLAARLVKDCGPDPGAQVDRGYQLTLARPPNALEREQALAFLTAQTAILKDRSNAESVALADFCLALLNRNEFIYVH